MAANWYEPKGLLLVGQVLLGLCSVIFIHELGHFAVAKWCGVKCEKFYLFFDLFGWKLFRFRRGETEYGIGWLPLGGYVKMLGQDDDPRKAAAELERARAQAEHGETSAAKPAFDPRSYLAKTVWRRMAIISAGVIMNVIFAVVLASVAFVGGVHEEPCLIGATTAGEPAWQAGLLPGDKIVEIGQTKSPLYKDLRAGVIFGDNIDEGVRFVVVREGRREPLELKIRPQTRSIFPMIGVMSAHTAELFGPAVGYKPAPYAELLQAGDIIVAVNGAPVAKGFEIDRELHRTADRVTLRMRRPLEPMKETILSHAELPPGEDFDVVLAPRPMKTVGFALTMGEITAVQDGSPAQLADLQPGDLLTSIDGQPIEDPLALADLLRGKDKALVAWRRQVEGGVLDLSKEIELRRDAWIEPPRMKGNKTTLPTLGVAFDVLNEVASVAPDGYAAAAGLEPGDKIVSAKVLPPPQQVMDKYEAKQQKYEIEELGDSNRDFPLLFSFLQDTLPESSLELVLADERTVTIASVESTTWFNVDRGLLLKPLLEKRVASSFGEALSMGLVETREALGMVYRFLQKLASRQVSVKSLGGPVEIAYGAYSSADRGWPELLLFLTMLSANLAVINFLPIPVLDGGHMVFLAYEAIRGKPPSDRVAGPLTWLGFLFLLSLMVFVFGMSLGFIPRFG